MPDSIISVDENIFNLTNESESIEGFEFKDSNVTIINQGDTITDINNDTILEFLRCPETKVFIKTFSDGSNETKLVAHNYISNETIEISNLGDHILAMNDLLLLAMNKRKEIKANPGAEIMSHDLIKGLNSKLLYFRYINEEIGIGEYRDYNFLNQPANVVIGPMENGIVKPIKEWQPIPGGHQNVQKHIDKLIEWTNSEEFKSLDPILRAAMFHAKFIHIHPFMDGNGRTGRMLLNYLLIVSGKKPTNIAAADYDEYFKANAEAIAHKNYDPLVNLIKKYQIAYSRELYASVVDHHKQRQRKINLQGRQI